MFESAYSKEQNNQQNYNTFRNLVRLDKNKFDRIIRHSRFSKAVVSFVGIYKPSNQLIMYVSSHLKWRILIARALRSFYYESENSSRNLKQVFNTYAHYLLGTTYDTFLNYLNKEKFDITGLKLPSYILIALELLESIRTTCERLHARKPAASWTLVGIVEELLAVVREKEKDHPGRKIRID